MAVLSLYQLLGSPASWTSPYAANKIGADQNQTVTVLKHCFGFTTFQHLWSSPGARAIIPTIITQVASGHQRIHLGALSPTRDFNFVADTCAAFQAIADCDSALGQVVNSASHFEISIGDTVSLIADVMNVELEIISDEDRMRPQGSEVNRLFGDNTRLKQLTGWQPAYGGIDGFRRGLVETCEWFSSPDNLVRYRPNTYVV